MIDSKDVDDLLGAKIIIEDKMGKIDCPYCKKHIQLVLDLLDDVVDISKFNSLYIQDPTALERYRQMVQKEYMLRVMAVGARFVGISRRIRTAVARHLHHPRPGRVETPPRQ